MESKYYETTLGMLEESLYRDGHSTEFASSVIEKIRDGVIEINEMDSIEKIKTIVLKHINGLDLVLDRLENMTTDEIIDLEETEENLSDIGLTVVEVVDTFFMDMPESE